MNYAKTTFIGRLTKDPDTKTTQAGMAITNSSIAINRKKKEGNETDFFDVTAFGKLAELFGQYATKGRLVHMEATPRVEKWQDPNGNNRQKVSFIVENFNLLDSNKASNENKDIPTYRPTTPEITSDDIPF